MKEAIDPKRLITQYKTRVGYLKTKVKKQNNEITNMRKAIKEKDFVIASEHKYFSQVK